MLSKKTLILFIALLFISVSILFIYKTKERYDYRYDRLKTNYDKISLAKETSDEEFQKIKNFFIEENKILSFYSSTNEINSLGDNKIIIKKYSNPIIYYSGKRSSLEYYDKKVYLITGKGQIYVNDSLVPKIDQINFIKIKTNLNELVDQNYVNHYETIFKDIIIKNSKVYISLTDWKSDVKPFNPGVDNCYFTSVFVANLSDKNLIFKKFFEMQECMPIFTNSSGSILEKFKNNEILLTIGDYGSCGKLAKNFAQDENHLAGKIISINEETGEYYLVSMGHRNQQGIYYDKENNIIFSTEHGPKGGDEININQLSIGEGKIKNYGWGNSSYGEHYDLNEEFKRKVYANCPLNKSHSKFDFQEPIKYFVPSIAITQIIKENNFIKNKDFIDTIYFSSLGYTNEDGRRSFHKIDLRKNNDFFDIVGHEYVPLNDRIRDMIYIEDKKLFVLFLELSGSIATISVYK